MFQEEEEETSEEDAFNLKRMEEKNIDNINNDNNNGIDGSASNSNIRRVGVTRYRWVILAVFSIENLVNSIMWICFGILLMI